ncbi:hypothetical protein QBC39DRAFT_70236 [Podospora conica]|nr:hypothetical protein QBC39DRAFT_70236 [Schizothecium conicum]
MRQGTRREATPVRMQFAGGLPSINTRGLVRCRSCISGTALLRLFLKIDIGHSGRHHLVKARRSSLARGTQAHGQQPRQGGKARQGRVNRWCERESSLSSRRLGSANRRGTNISKSPIPDSLQAGGSAWQRVELWLAALWLRKSLQSARHQDQQPSTEYHSSGEGARGWDDSWPVVWGMISAGPGALPVQLESDAMLLCYHPGHRCRYAIGHWHDRGASNAVGGQFPCYRRLWSSGVGATWP